MIVNKNTIHSAGFLRNLILSHNNKNLLNAFFLYDPSFDIVTVSHRRSEIGGHLPRGPNISQQRRSLGKDMEGSSPSQTKFHNLKIVPRGNKSPLKLHVIMLKYIVIIGSSTSGPTKQITFRHVYLYF